MFDFSSIVPTFAYLSVLLILLIVFAAVSYVAYKGGKRKRRRNKYGRPVTDIEDSLVTDLMFAFAIILLPAWMVHGFSTLQFLSPSEGGYDPVISLWAVAAYWCMALGIGFAYVRLLRQDVQISAAGGCSTFLLSFSWFVWGFAPLNSLFVL